MLFYPLECSPVVVGVVPVSVLDADQKPADQEGARQQVSERACI